MRQYALWSLAMGPVDVGYMLGAEHTECCRVASHLTCRTDKEWGLASFGPVRGIQRVLEWYLYFHAWLKPLPNGNGVGGGGTWECHSWGNTSAATGELGRPAMA